MYQYYVTRGTVAAIPDNSSTDRRLDLPASQGAYRTARPERHCARQEVYGWHQLLQAALAQLNGLALTESTLYPVLGAACRRPPGRGAASSLAVWPAAAPYYRLTSAGQKRLDDMLVHWRQVNASIETLLIAPPPIAQGEIR